VPSSHLHHPELAGDGIGLVQAVKSGIAIGMEIAMAVFE